MESDFRENMTTIPIGKDVEYLYRERYL